MGCCGGILKLLLFLFNISLIAAGISLVVVGGVVAEEFREYSDEKLFDDKYLWAPVAMAIVCGLLLLFVGLTGVGGLCCKNQCMLKLYIVLLFLLIILEVVLCIIALVYKDDGEADAKKSIHRVIGTVYSHNTTSKTREVLDKLQRKFHCCGGQGISDYTNQTVRIPDSCCKDKNHTSNCGASQDPAVFHDKGCAKALFDKISDYSHSLFAVGIVFAILQIAGLFLACKYLREDKD